MTLKEEDLAPLEDMNTLDIEAIYKWCMAHLKLWHEVQSMINLVQNLTSAMVSYGEGEEGSDSDAASYTESEDEDGPKKRTKMLNKSKDGKPKRYLAFNVFKAAR